MLQVNFTKEGNWYEGLEFSDSHLVTSANHNKDLGIAGIILSKPNGGEHAIEKMVRASVTVLFENGLTMYGTLYENTKGGFNFGVATRKYKDASGVEQSVNQNLGNIPMAIQAQIMRYAATRTQVVASAPVVETPAPVATPEPVATPAPVTTPAPVATVAVGQAETLKALLSKPGLTADQINAIISAM